MKFTFRKAVLVLIVISALAGIHLYIYTQNIGLKFGANDLKVRLGELRSKNRNLGSQAARMEDLGRVEKSAGEKLKMFYPEEINYIFRPRAEQGSEARP